MSDLISRQAAIDAALTFIVEYCGAAFDIKMQEGMIKKLKDIPSAEPERNHGKWMGTVCSVCGESTVNYYDCEYCPKCGARMDG